MGRKRIVLRQDCPAAAGKPVAALAAPSLRDAVRPRQRHQCADAKLRLALFDSCDLANLLCRLAHPLALRAAKPGHALGDVTACSTTALREEGGKPCGRLALSPHHHM